MEKSVVKAIIITVGIFTGIVLYALEFGNISNYVSKMDLLKLGLVLGLPLGVFVAYSTYTFNAFVRPMVYRLMAFFFILCLLFSPLVVHLLNFYLPSEIAKTEKLEIKGINGHSITRFGMLEKAEKLNTDYFSIELENDNEAYVFRMNDISNIASMDMSIDENNGFLNIPFLSLSDEN